MNVSGKPSIHTLFQFFQDFCMALFFNAVIKNAFFKNCQFKLLEFCCAIKFTTVRLVARFFFPKLCCATLQIFHFCRNARYISLSTSSCSFLLSRQKNQPRPPVSQGKTLLPTTSPTVPIITLDITTKQHALI